MKSAPACSDAYDALAIGHERLRRFKLAIQIAQQRPLPVELRQLHPHPLAMLEVRRPVELGDAAGANQRFAKAGHNAAAIAQQFGLLREQGLQTVKIAA
jgi:hypothetical protein